MADPSATATARDTDLHANLRNHARFRAELRQRRGLVTLLAGAVGVLGMRLAVTESTVGRPPFLQWIPAALAFSLYCYLLVVAHGPRRDA